MTQITAGPGKFQSCLKFPPSVHLGPGEHCVSDLQLKREDTLRFSRKRPLWAPAGKGGVQLPTVGASGSLSFEGSIWYLTESLPTIIRPD